MKSIIVLVLAGFLLSGIFFINPLVKGQETTGNKLYVGGSGMGNYSSIQDAIDNATDGDTIYVFDGTFSHILVNKSLSIIGNGSASTFISDHFETIIITANWTNISGFTVKSIFPIISGTQPNCGIELINAANCKIENINVSSSNLGIYLYGSNDNAIVNNTIIDNLGTGIYLDSCRNNKIYYNNFINNSNNAVDTGNNTWDNGEFGNYWDNYTGLDKNNDGVGDTLYNIPGGNNQDRYPLMMPYDGKIRIKEFFVDQGSLITMLIIGMIIVIAFVVPIGYYWYKKGWRY